MAFLKHVGRKVSKFHFEFILDTVIGVYPSSYSRDIHSTSGIYVILKRGKKCHRSKISMPENGGYVNMDERMSFTSTLYQKKRKNEKDETQMMSKKFCLTVLNASNSKIKWQTDIDLSQYASVFGADVQEQFTLSFAHKSFKSRQSKSYRDGMSHIPMEITIRLGIKCIWLKHLDSMSQSSTGSSIYSSSMLSELSDLGNLNLFDLKKSAVPTLPAIPNEKKTFSVKVTSPKNKSEKSPEEKIPPKKKNDDGILNKFVMSSEDSMLFLHNQCNLSMNFIGESMKRPSKSNRFFQNETSILEEPSTEQFNNTFLDLHSCSILMDNEFHKSVNFNNMSNDKNVNEDESNFTFINEFNGMLSECDDESAESAESQNWDLTDLTDYLFNICVSDIYETMVDERIWDEMLPKHTVVAFRCFLHWQLFKNDKEQILQTYLTQISKQMELHSNNDMEQSYWLLSLTSLLFCVDTLSPEQLKECNEENIQSFTRKTLDLSNCCFDTLIDSLLQKMERIPFHHIFDDQEFGQTGSDTMELVFALLLSIVTIWHEITMFCSFQAQIMEIAFRYCVCRVVSMLLQNEEVCTVAAGFRLKIIKSMITDFHKSNDFDISLMTQKLCLDLLEDVSVLLLSCSVCQSVDDLRSLCPSLNCNKISILLKNFNKDCSKKESLSQEMIIGFCKEAEKEKGNQNNNVIFYKQSMRKLDFNNLQLPKIKLSDVDVPFIITQHQAFDFLSKS